MLNIENSGAEIAATNYWRSQYNERDFAYLSSSAGALRLLLPSATATAWLAEIKTAQKVIIEPSLRGAQYPNHLDLVFDDGSKNPFILTIDKERQIDRGLSGGQYELVVYAGSLKNRHTLPCTVVNAPPRRERDLNHITIDTGHSRMIPRAEMDDETIEVLKAWVARMAQGETVGIYEDKYVCRISEQTPRMVEFVISSLDEMMQPTDIIRAVCCRHNTAKRRAWHLAEGQSAEPQVPFLAVKFLDIVTMMRAMHDLPMLAGFEAAIAWAWLERAQNQNK